MTSFASDLGPPANALELQETRLHKTPAFLYFEREACFIGFWSPFLQGIVELLYKLLRVCECSEEGELRWECWHDWNFRENFIRKMTCLLLSIALIEYHLEINL